MKNYEEQANFVEYLQEVKQYSQQDTKVMVDLALKSLNESLQALPHLLDEKDYVQIAYRLHKVSSVYRLFDMNMMEVRLKNFETKIRQTKEFDEDLYSVIWDNLMYLQAKIIEDQKRSCN